MNITFATKDRQTALGYLKKIYPSYDVNEKSAKCILDLVPEKIRVGDPLMYGKNCPIYPENGFTTEEFMTIYDKFIDNLKLKITHVTV
jgi:hypothetical protein